MVTGTDIVKYAKHFIGKCRYTLGEQNPNSQCDCSGFIWYVYHHFFPQQFALRTDARGYAKYGKKVSKNKLQAGDIVVMHTNWRGTVFSDPDHVGIYCGGDKIIQVGHNSSQNGCYLISKSACNGIILYGRRIINTTVKKLNRTYTVQCVMNVRKSHSTDSKIIRTVKKGHKYVATKTYNHWAYFPKLKGWICIKSGNETYLK